MTICYCEERMCSLRAVERDGALAFVTVGVLTVLSEDRPQQGPMSIHLQPISTAIILKNLPQGVCLLFGLTYALPLDYPKCMANTLKFIQTVILGLGTKTLSPKLLMLKNNLLCQTAKDLLGMSQTSLLNFAIIALLLEKSSTFL